MDRRTFVSTTIAAATSSLLASAANAQPIPKAKNIVLIHGLFADGSCWSEVIPELRQAKIKETIRYRRVTADITPVGSSG